MKRGLGRKGKEVRGGVAAASGVYLAYLDGMGIEMARRAVISSRFLPGKTVVLRVCRLLFQITAQRYTVYIRRFFPSCCIYWLFFCCGLHGTLPCLAFMSAFCPESWARPPLCATIRSFSLISLFHSFPPYPPARGGFKSSSTLYFQHSLAFSLLNIPASSLSYLEQLLQLSRQTLLD